MYLLFFFNDTATTEIYTLSLHDALPISSPFSQGYTQNQMGGGMGGPVVRDRLFAFAALQGRWKDQALRSEEHTSELQSRLHLVCRLLLEKKKRTTLPHTRVI